MPINNPTDFFKYSWHVVHHIPSWNKYSISRILILSLIFLILQIGLYFLNSKIGFGSTIFLWLMSAISLVIFLILGFFLHMISTKNQKVNIIYYDINALGFKIGKNLILFSKFDPLDIEELAGDIEKHTQTQDNLIKLLLPLNHKRQVVWFNNDHELTKFVKSLRAYLKT